MGGLFTQVLPLALGAAVSPALLTLVLLMLAGRHQPVPRSWAYVLGVALVVVVLVGLGLAFLGRLPDHATGAESPAQAWGKVAAGAALALLGVRGLLPQGSPSEAHLRRVQARQSKLAAAGLGTFVAVGVVAMLLNFSSIVLMLPALHDISVSDSDVATKAAVTTFLALMVLVPAVVPVLLVTLLGHRSDAVLARLNAFTTAHQRQINAGICFVFAALLLGGGIKGLLT